MRHRSVPVCSPHTAYPTRSADCASANHGPQPPTPIKGSPPPNQRVVLSLLDRTDTAACSTLASAQSQSSTRFVSNFETTSFSTLRVFSSPPTMWVKCKLGTFLLSCSPRCRRRPSRRLAFFAAGGGCCCFHPMLLSSFHVSLSLHHAIDTWSLSFAMVTSHHRRHSQHTSSLSCLFLAVVCYCRRWRWSCHFTSSPPCQHASSLSRLTLWHSSLSLSSSLLSTVLPWLIMR